MKRTAAVFFLFSLTAYRATAASESCRTAYTLPLDGGVGPDAGDFLRTETAADSGVCITWATRTIGYRISANGSDNLSVTAAQQAVRDSFASWSKENITVCSSELAFSDFGSNSSPVLNGSDRVNNIFWVESGWTANTGLSASAIALTTISFYASTGEIIDGDIEFNGQYFTFTVVDGGCAGKQDIQNTATHEIGHLVGLDSSLSPQTTMYDSSPSCDTNKRTLHPGDMFGACQIYGPGQGLNLDAGSDAGVGVDAGVGADGGSESDGGMDADAGLADAGGTTGGAGNTANGNGGCALTPVKGNDWASVLPVILLASLLYAIGQRRIRKPQIESPR